MSERLEHFRLKSWFYERVGCDFIDNTVYRKSVELVFKKFDLTAIKTKSDLNRIKESDSYKI